MKRLQLVTREDEAVAEVEDALYQDFLSEFDYLQPAQSDATPPRVLASSDRDETTIVTRQPPREVRTSKAKDKRVFTCAIKPAPTATPTTCTIVFGDTLEPVPGEQTFVCNAQGEFTDLQVLTPSLKCNDRDMCLRFHLSPNQYCYSESFYSYSNVGVLKRRREVELVALSTSNNKRRFHVVGKTFFASPKLAVVFRFQAVGSAWRTLLAGNLECYSDSVLFFDPPTTSQLVSVLGCTPGCNNRVFVQCTNDGRNCSNALEHCLYVPLAVSSSPRSLVSFFPPSDGNSDEEFQARL